MGKVHFRVNEKSSDKQNRQKSLSLGSFYSSEAFVTSEYTEVV